MSRQASPQAVGLFVLGAIMVAALGVVTFGGSQLFHGGERYRVQFAESLKGLRVGAPVTFRGIEIGQVEDIRAIYDPTTGSVKVPVTLELRQGALSTNGAADSDMITDLVARGLRARLDLQSIVTGQLLVALDFYQRPMVSGTTADLPADEIPSIPSTWAGLQRTVDDALLNAPEIARTLQELTVAMRDLLAGSTGDSIRRGAVALSELLQGFADPQGPFARSMAELPELVASLEALAEAGTGLVTEGDRRLQSLGDEATRLSVSLRRVADQASGVIGDNRTDLKQFTEDGLPAFLGLVEDATRLVNELSGTVRDMRQDPARFFLGSRDRQGVQLP